MAEDRKKLIEVQDLVVRFGSRRHAFTAVDNVSFHIYQGETFGLVGESGSGKTTIGRAIIRIHPTAGGKILFDGKQINGRISKALDREVTQRIQMIFQDPMSSLNERAKVDYIVSEGLYAGGHHLSESERQAKVASALSDVGLLPEFASRFPHEFSGGQRQRIGIARALIMEPDFIIADEPISALDVSIRAQVLNLLSKLQKERESDLSVHRPRPVGGSLHLRPHRRHSQGRDRGAGGERGAVRPSPAPLHPRAAVRHSPARPHRGAAEKAHRLRPQLPSLQRDEPAGLV